MSAIDVLAEEVVEIERDLVLTRERAENARVTATEARQRLDTANAAVRADEDRLEATRTALTVIAGRDRVSDETLDTVLARLRDARS